MLKESIKNSSGVYDRADDMLAGRQVDARLRGDEIVVPTARIRKRHGPCDIRSIQLEADDAAITDGGRQRLKLVGARSRDVDRVLEPLTRYRPSDTVAVGTATGTNVNARVAIVTAIVGGRRVVVSDRPHTVIEVPRLNGAGHCPGCAAAVIGRMRRHQPVLIQVQPGILLAMAH